MDERREFGSLRLRGRIWWLRYRVDGKEHWESSRSSSEKEAAKLLARRQAELGAGILTAPDARRVTFDDLEQLLLADYRRNNRRSLARAAYAIALHLRPALEATRAVAITTDRVSRYEADRLAAGASRATVNYELALLRRMFRLAIAGRRLSTAPAITIADPKNARTGFFEPEDFAAVLAQLPEHLKPVFRFAYVTGWRVKSEVLPLTWDRVDFRAGTVRLDVNTTKTDRGRVFPFAAVPELAAVLEEQRARTSALEKSTGRIIAQVFHRNGKPIRSYRHGWAAACRRAAVDGRKGELAVLTRPQLLGRIAHDFRRTAVRNLVRAGVPERVAMALTGHKTREVFDRYNIVNEADLAAGASKLAAYLEQGSEQAAKGTTGGQSPLRIVASE